MTVSFARDGMNWDFVKQCAKAAAGTGNVDVMKIVINIFMEKSSKPSEIGEIFSLETISTGKASMVTSLLQHWASTRSPFVSIISNVNISSTL